MGKGLCFTLHSDSALCRDKQQAEAPLQLTMWQQSVTVTLGHGGRGQPGSSAGHQNKLAPRPMKAGETGSSEAALAPGPAAPAALTLKPGRACTGP